MMFSLRKPWYLLSRARGVSQWKMVTNGFSPITRLRCVIVDDGLITYYTVDGWQGQLIN